jgi:hypothetical protein
MSTADKLAAILSGDIGAISKLGPVSKIAGDTARCAIGSEPGNRLIGADLVAIEACVGAWVAGDEVELERWRRFLADRTNVELDPYRIEGLNTGFPEVIARSRGKVQSLAFQYMGGVAAFRNLAPDDFVISDDEINKLKWDWRNRHRKITDCWDALDTAAVAAVSGGPGTSIPCGKVVFRCELLCGGTFLYIDLPSGRSIAYPFTCIVKNKFGEPAVTFKDNARGQWLDYRTKSAKKAKPPAEDESGVEDDDGEDDPRDEEEQTGGAYGGTWFENIVSGIARDLLAAAMLRVEAAGYPIVLHVHDEVVSEVPDGFGSVEEYVRLVEQLPDWAEGIPVGAKGRNGPRFAKVDVPIVPVPGRFIDEPLPTRPKAKESGNGARKGSGAARKRKSKAKAMNGAPVEWLCAPIEPCDLYQISGPNHGMAERFLTLLDPTTDQFTFQTATDGDKPAGKDPLAFVRHGSLDQHFPELCRLNARGAAIWVAVNRTDLKGRQARNITEVRWWFSDQDDAPIPDGCPQPVMKVESSAGKFGLYFRPGDRALAAFTPAQNAIAAFCGGDTVNDLPRVMRLPGFIHRKVKGGVAGPPFRSRIVEVNESARAVTIDDFATTSRNEAPSIAPTNNTDAELWVTLDGLEGRGVVDLESFTEGLTPWAALNALALDNLGEWVPELLGGIAVHHESTGAYRVSSASISGDLAEALGRDSEVAYQEDLSIHPDGIKDYGLASGAHGEDTGQGRHSPLDLVKAVLGLDFNGAFAWLNERLREPEEQPQPSEGGTGNGASEPPKGNGSRNDGGNSGPHLLPGPAPEPKPDAKPDDWPVLHRDALYGTAGKIVRAIEPHTESDPVALLIQEIVYFGNAIGRGPYYLIEDDKHYTNLFANLVGESSYARKGTSAGRIRALFVRADGDWAVKCIGGGLSSGEGMIHRIRDPRQTVDAKGKPRIDPGVTDKRLLIDEGEFYRALAVMKREGNTLSDVIRNAWDGKPLRTLTKNSPTEVLEPHISAIAHITEDELRQHLDHTSLVNGFANRFLFTLVRRSKLLAHGGASLDEETKHLLGQELRFALESARKIGRVTMAAETAEMWVPIYERMSKRPEGLYADACKRGDAQTIRLSMIYALLDGKAIIEPVHLRAGLALWDYCEAGTKRIFGDLLGEPVADTILKALRRAEPAGLTRTMISAILGHNRAASAISAALERLLLAGKARCGVKNDNLGRSMELWHAS